MLAFKKGLMLVCIGLTIGAFVGFNFRRQSIKIVYPASGKIIVMPLPLFSPEVIITISKDGLWDVSIKS